ncbi:electron transport complex subunit RsxG [Catenovulum sp. SM1970]|uniref:electron transport complex subunit RsxG n=1 Tax=Marinifaba aquimaris TaxID=2741323 RepID=UPI00157364F8|nr:electron transport complex subunit RsxG [Marinifaba aquimaris]NTS78455.1 electron transport complex subunit RsxG [Marinifaba aquimaris]
MIKQVKKSSLVLAAFALASTALVTLVHIFTAPKIAEQQALAQIKVLDEIIDRESYNNDLANDCVITSDENGKAIKVFRARKDGIPVAIATEVIVLDGYNGRMDLILALDINSKVLGTRTTFHQETPGLGDKIEIKRSDWITKFNDNEVNGEDDSRWAVRKDGGMFDQFTGATITPRAIVKGLKRTILWHQQEQGNLFDLTSNCEK